MTLPALRRVTSSSSAFRAVLAAAVLAVLAGCATRPVDSGDDLPPGPPPTWTVPSGEGPALTPLAFNQLTGWTTDRTSEALTAFMIGCAQMDGNAAKTLGGQGTAASLGGSPIQWQRACAAARQVPPGDDAAARAYFETNFQAYGVSSDGRAEGLFTGYYEPEVAGSRSPGRDYKVPLYRRPPGLAPGRPYLTRAEIDRGGLNGRRLELLWLSNPVDAFFLHVQGSGRIRLADGHTVRVNYDGQNGRSYVPIGRVLVSRGEMTLDQVSMQSIRAWLAVHPDQAKALMEQNPSYVFFREVNGLSADMGAPGALGAALTPLRSIAVDKGFIPLGAPVWINTRDAIDGSDFKHLMVAQDLGGAITGPVRADIFFGWGADAENRAGLMRQHGTEIVLLPKNG